MTERLDKIESLARDLFVHAEGGTGMDARDAVKSAEAFYAEIDAWRAVTSDPAAELAREVRRIVKAIDEDPPDDVQELVAPLRARGIEPHVHVGRPGGSEAVTPELTVEWYAGQLLAIVDEGAWFAMDSLICALDKFVPDPDAPTEEPQP
jgi:hypothetical protein